jgi:putative membrane protein
VKGIVLDIATTAIAFVILTMLLTQVKYDNNLVHLVGIAVLFGIANSLIKPVLKLLTFPINMMTMGLVGILINAGLMLGVAYVADHFLKITFTISGFPGHGLTADVFLTAAIASVVLGILTAIIGMVVHD